MARKDIDHMQALLSDNYRYITKWQPYLDSDEQDYDGGATDRLSTSHLGVAVYEYILNHNIEAFRAHLLKAIQYGLYNIKKYDQGLPVRHSKVRYSNLESGSVNLLTYALVLGSPELVKTVAAEVKFRKDPDNPNSTFSSWDHIYSELSLGNFDLAADLLREDRDSGPIKGLDDKIRESSYFIYDIIINNKNYSGTQLISSFTRSQKERIKKKYSIWAHTVYEDLNLQAIAQLNLLRFYGFEVNIPEDILIPSELLVDPAVAPYRHLMSDL